MKNEKTITQALQVAEKKVNELAELSRFKVNSQPTFEKAAQILKSIKEYKEAVQEQKDKIIKPLNEALKNTREMFAPLEEKILVVEKFMKSEALNYNNKLIEEQKKREAEAQSKIEAGESFEKATKSVARVEQKVASIPTRKVQKLLIEDATLIPRNFLIPDESKIKDALKAGYTVPGCKMVEETILVNSFK